MPAPGEPLWQEDDRAEALALLAEEAEECPGCGWPLDECTDPASEGRWKTTPVRCHRCTAQHYRARVHSESGAAPGFLIRAEPIPESLLT